MPQDHVQMIHIGQSHVIIFTLSFVSSLFTGSCPDDPPSVDNATPTLSDDGNTATYTCVKGYQLKDMNVKTSTCDGTSGVWSNVGDLCQIKGLFSFLFVCFLIPHNIYQD